MVGQKFDVIVIGGGHAGIEAAYASANMGSKTLLLTLKKDKIGWMPCNPSVGGLGKGHIVYEVSALGGLMPKLCSKTYLQARMLNTKKGPAVQGLRLQIDKYKYNDLAIKTLNSIHNLSIYEDMASKLLVQDGKVFGIQCESGDFFYSEAIVITTGTFLNGRIHIGDYNQSAGRFGEDAAIGLSESLSKLGLSIGRLKTGTPPRLLRSSIDFSKLEQQDVHDLDYLFEWNSTKSIDKVPCYIGYTNEKTHKIIKDNLMRSAMYKGNIEGIGPRYCPSIEDKIHRFPDKLAHHVFIEPEGENLEEVYPAGLSTSLPLDVQNDYIHSIEGLEAAVITKAGYAVEYDFVQPTHLKSTLESKKIVGLFCAGQINGTTGYEEAAGQGIIAGINASLKASSKESFILEREESYIGVMIDDLITLGTDEPYRMFTSRAERRLLLRQDNVFTRIMPYGKKLGLISEDVYKQFLEEQRLLEQMLSFVKESGSDCIKFLNVVEFTQDYQEQVRKILYLRFEQNISSRLLLSLHAEIKYSGYLSRELKEVERVKRYKEMEIPATFIYENISGLSIELRGKLTKFRPNTIAQAQLISGMTPAAISLLILQIKLMKNKLV